MENTKDKSKLAGSRNRRTFLKSAAAVGLGAVGMTTLPVAASRAKSTKSLEPFNFSLAIPDGDSENAVYYVSKKLFAPEEGIDLNIVSGTTTTQFVQLTESGHFDASQPSPFLVSILRDKGLAVKFYFDNMAINIFGFAVRGDSKIDSIEQMSGAKIAESLTGWSALWNPGLAAAGVDLSSVKYIAVGLGSARLNAVQTGLTDVMVTWDGDIAVQNWNAKLAGEPQLKYFSEEPFFKTPSNGFVAADSAFENPEKRSLLIRAARAQAKAMWFAKENPAAAATIFHEYWPKVHTAPGQAEEILTSYNDTGFSSGSDGTLARGLGWNSKERWVTQLNSMTSNKFIENDLQPGDMFTNDLIEEINNFDKESIIDMAKNYKL